MIAYDMTDIYENQDEWSNLDQRITLFWTLALPIDESPQQLWKQNPRKPPNELISDVDCNQTAGGKLGKLFSIIEPCQNCSGTAVQNNYRSCTTRNNPYNGLANTHNHRARPYAPVALTAQLGNRSTSS